MTQTAVEWLIKKYHDYGTLYYEDMTQAKAMEREQTAKAWDAGKHQYFSLGIPEIEFNNGEEYYDINYNKHMENKQQTVSELQQTNPFKQRKAVGWYCIGHEGFANTTAFATYYKPNAIKRFFMRTLLDFYWIKDENK